jgi:hypothetical protein
MLFFDDMSVAIQSIIENNRLKAQLDKTFQLKSGREKKQILGI